MKSSAEPRTVYLPDVIGGGYSEFWHSRHRYRVVKGSRGSKKSTTASLWYIYQLMKNPEANLLVVRKTFRTLKDSCWTQLRWAANRLGVAAAWKFTLSPLEATYRPTGQKIYFRGLDDPLKISSITVDHGHLCWIWIEEAYEISLEADFDMLDESIRGDTGDLWKQLTLTFNPWSDRHWLKSRFFDQEHEDVMAMTTTYKCNEWLDGSDFQMYETMRERNPRRYRVAGLGEWGVAEGLIFENWREERFDPERLVEERQAAMRDQLERKRRGQLPRDEHELGPIEELYGLDFGYTNDPTAVCFLLVDLDHMRLYVWDEIYQRGMTNEHIAEELLERGLEHQVITADSAEPKSIDRLRLLGLRGLRGARKGRDSINAGIDYLQGFEIIVHPRCVNYLREISTYTWDQDRFGKALNRPAEGEDHLMDATRYAIEHLARPRNFSFR